MCTAISFKTKDHYFGRNLDLEYHYQEEVVITPRNYPLPFRCIHRMEQHFAFIGMATVADDYPLYYDATNEFGLSIAALNFPGNAVYRSAEPRKDNIAAFELIPWVLGQCRSLAEARALLSRSNLLNVSISETLPTSPLHWMVSDASGSIVAEPLETGIVLHKNPINVLTNNPPFPYHLLHIQDYLNITREAPDNRFADGLILKPYSNGMGAIGLPGDLSSASRFVRAAFTLQNSVCTDGENESVSQFFHILDCVAQTRGSARVGNDFEITYYSSCCNTNKGIYYYKTYENSQISAVDLRKEDLNGKSLFRFPLITTQQINIINKEKPSV
jgi:choloylglycine hydrolase